jgi:hypothetical protein
VRQERPPNPRLNPLAPLAKGLVFAGLGGGAGSGVMVDACASLGRGKHGVLTGYSGAGNTPMDNWKFDQYLGRWTLATGYMKYVQCAVNGLLTGFASQTCTLSGWIKRSAGTGDEIIFSYDFTDHSAPYYARMLSTRNGHYFWAWNDGSANQALETSTGAVANVWTAFAATFTSGSQQIWSNGALLGSSARTDTVAFYNQEVWIGKSNYSYAGIPYVADLLYHNRVLSPPEIARLADPTNVMLDGLIVPPRRVLWVVGGGGGATYTESVTVSASGSSLLADLAAFLDTPTVSATGSSLGAGLLAATDGPSVSATGTLAEADVLAAVDSVSVSAQASAVKAEVADFVDLLAAAGSAAVAVGDFYGVTENAVAAATASVEMSDVLAAIASVVASASASASVADVAAMTELLTAIATGSAAVTIWNVGGTGPASIIAAFVVLKSKRK